MGEIIKKMKGDRFIGWYLRFVDLDGKRKQRASGQPTFAEAKRMLIEIEARIARGKLGVPERDRSTTLTVQDLTERFLAEYDSPRIRDVTRWAAKQRIILRPVLDEVGGERAASFDVSRAERLRNRLMRRYAANSARGQLSALGSVFAWATKQRLLTSNPLRELKKPQKVARIEYLSTEDARKLLASADQKAEQSLRAAVLATALRLGLLAGLRAGEIFGLRWQDVDLTRRRLTVARSYEGLPKNGKVRTLPLPIPLMDELSQWKPLCAPSLLVCPLGKMGMVAFQKILREAGCPAVSRPWHSLRHTFASLLIEQGGSILALKELLGHSSLDMSLIYSHLAPGALAAEDGKIKL